MNISVLILTWNEEINLATCLEGAKWCNDIVVFDSFSTDKTAEIARAAGARVVQRRFDNYGSQREAARIEINYKYPWVLALDADEVPDQELVEEMMKIADMPNSSLAAYRMRRKDFFMGRWIKYSTLYPSWFVRFYKPDCIRYEPRAVHEYPTVFGKIGELQGHLMHHSFNKGMSDWLRKHVRYAELEALESLQHARLGQIDWKGLSAIKDPVRRRRALKAISFRLPLRPTLRFLYMYFFRLGMLDGRAGFTYCRLLAIYEYMIVLRIMELRRRENGLSI
jgi:glycosyltransferase involved in cell wall biosynthesis